MRIESVIGVRILETHGCAGGGIGPVTPADVGGHGATLAQMEEIVGFVHAEVFEACGGDC